MCAFSINSYEWESRESEGKRPKTTPSPHMRLWFIYRMFLGYRKVYMFGCIRRFDIKNQTIYLGHLSGSLKQKLQ